MDPTLRPSLRGVFHEYAFVGFSVLGAVLVATAPGARERAAAAVFACSLAAAFGVSALYHRVAWGPAARRAMRRLDHAAAYLLIAGTYTPFCLLVLTGAWQVSLLALVWLGAAAAIVHRIVWLDAPTWHSAVAGMALGWAGAVALPEVGGTVGAAGVALVVAGGVLYTAGAVVYALRRPDPVPAVFGFHELFHLLTILAAACQYAAVAFVLHGRA